MNWQPIATAPLDGTPVLLWVIMPNDYYRDDNEDFNRAVQKFVSIPITASWRECDWDRDYEPKGVWGLLWGCNNEDSFLVFGTPTHWAEIMSPIV